MFLFLFFDHHRPPASVPFDRAVSLCVCAWVNGYLFSDLFLGVWPGRARNGLSSSWMMDGCPTVAFNGVCYFDKGLWVRRTWAI